MAFKTRIIRVSIFRPDPTAHFARWSGRALAPDEKAIILALEKQRFSRRPIRLLVNDENRSDSLPRLFASYLAFRSTLPVRAFRNALPARVLRSPSPRSPVLMVEPPRAVPTER